MPMLMRIIPLLFLVTLLTSSVVAKAPEGSLAQQLIEDLLNKELQKKTIVGVSLAITKNGTLVHAAGYGFANLAASVKAAPDTAYRIGSVSKQFIAAAIMLLIEEHKLRSDNRIVGYLPDAPEAWRGITVQHLLTHTSGLARRPPGYNPAVPQADIDVIRSAYALPLQFPPGDEFSYSNIGYYILAEIIRRVTGGDWAGFIEARVFAPANMHATRPTSEIKGTNLARGYVRKNGDWRPVVEAVALRPSGAFVSTVLDLAKWETALLQEAILSKDVLRRMWSPVRLNSGISYPYGFGWRLKMSKDTVTAVYHSGSQPGFRAYYYRELNERLAIIMLANSSNATELARLSRDIAVIYLGRNLAADRDLHEDEE